MSTVYALQNKLDTGMAHLAAGRIDQARSCFTSALRKQPDHPEAVHGLACVARAEGRPGEAIARLASIVRQQLPDRAKARYHLTLGYALFEAGHTEEARAAFSVATLLEPQDYRAFLGLGEMLLRQGKTQEGFSCWDDALGLAADTLLIYQSCAECLMALRLFDDAVRYFRLIAEQHSENGFVWANLGAALFETGQMQDALKALDRACFLGADTPHTRVNRALTCLASGHFSRAEADMSWATAHAPHDRRIRNNAATLLQQMGHHSEAEAEYAALMQADDFEAAQAGFNLATLRLAQGRMRDGWRLFEYRHVVLPRQNDLPRWDGRKTDAVVCIEAEQGAGDFIQFLRYVPEALDRAPVILKADAALQGLVSLNESLRHALHCGRLRFEGVAQQFCTLMSLPFLLDHAQPDPRPYLNARNESTSYAGVAHDVGRLRVGVCWSGSKRYRFDARRSIDASALDSLWTTPNVTFVALCAWDQVREKPGNMTTTQLNDWVITARELSRCDLVISVDTAVAHLAGALGRPLWLLNRFGGDWRWDGPDWYQNVRIFQAQRAEPCALSWQPVIARVEALLEDHRSKNVAFSGDARIVDC